MSTIDNSNLRQLAVFAQVVESGSFAAAARALSSSRSRVSEQVSQLEQALQVRLLQRSTRQLELTAEGQLVYAQAQALPDILQRVEAAISSPEPSGRVALTLNHDIAHKHVLPLLGEFRERYPQVQLDLVLDDEKIDLIHDKIDLAIRVGIPDDDSLIARVMHEECFSIYASPDYLRKNGHPKTIKELSEHHWITLSQLHNNGLLRFRQSGKHIEVQPDDYCQCNSPLMLQQMVINGLGIGAMFEATVRPELARGELIHLMPTVASEAQVFYLIYPSRRQLPLRTRVLIDFLLERDVFAADAL